MGDYGGGRKNQYFVPGDGIAREVITADICKYLDNDATVRPTSYNGRDGYMIYAYRNLTNAMIEDLRKDTLLWERERERRSRNTGGGDRGDRRPNARYDPYPPQNTRNGAVSGPGGNPGVSVGAPASSGGGNSGGGMNHHEALAAYQDSQTHERRSQILGPSQPQGMGGGGWMDTNMRENPSPHSSDNGFARPVDPYAANNPSPSHTVQMGGMNHGPGGYSNSMQSQPVYQADYNMDQGQGGPGGGYSQGGYQAQHSYESLPMNGPQGQNGPMSGGGRNFGPGPQPVPSGYPSRPSREYDDYGPPRTGSGSGSAPRSTRPDRMDTSGGHPPEEWGPRGQYGGYQDGRNAQQARRY